MKKFKDNFNNSRLMKFVYSIVPQYALLPIIMTFAVNMLVYNGARWLNEDRVMLDMTGALDRATPLVTEFVLIYVLAFPFWAANYIIAARQSRENCYRMVCADLIAKVLCGVIFLIVPTTNVRPVVESDGLWNWGLNVIYGLDKADNLFPSIHCLESWMCFAGVRACTKVDKRYKVFSFAMALLVCASTVLIRQHVWADVFSGVILAELTWQAAPRIIALFQNEKQRRRRKVYYLR